ncbi:MAG: hypothetical protein OXU23_14540, partial [Candidatus Poribacteria bacterium]|nr:hypothetical protein [Candidatus Poribacteria bacterium]
DNTVRLCPNYATDFIDANFISGGIDEVNMAVKLLNSKINYPPNSKVECYYAGVVALLDSNDTTVARRAFKKAWDLGYKSRKIERHLRNLKVY